MSAAFFVVRATVKDPARRKAFDSWYQLKAARADLTGRLVSGTVQDNPVIEVVVKLLAASAPAWHPAAAIPLDADITAVMKGMNSRASLKL